MLLGSYDKCVHSIREANRDKTAYVVEVLISHSQLAKKNQVSSMVLNLIKILRFCNMNKTWINIYF